MLKAREARPRAGMRNPSLRDASFPKAKVTENYCIIACFPRKNDGSVMS